MTASSERLAVSRKKTVESSIFGRIVVCLLLTLSPLTVAEAQQPKKIPRIGYLSSNNAAVAAPAAEGIRKALRELGYVEGKNIMSEYRYADGKTDRAPELAAELVRLKVDIIVVTGGTLRWVRPVMDATKTIPIVMTGAGADPVESGIVESLGRPGSNVTGITNLSAELSGKQLELFKEAVPRLTHVAVLYDPDSPSNVNRVKKILPPVAWSLKLTLRLWEVRGREHVEKVLTELRKVRSDGIYVAPGPPTNANAKQIADFALTNRLPSMYGGRAGAEVGGLMFYGADAGDSYRRVAYFIDRILKGAKPADLPVEQPTKFEFVINLKTAKQIGVTIPPDVLARATKIIR
jgi:putative ABC transport system substrate-binding protein